MNIIARLPEPSRTLARAVAYFINNPGPVEPEMAAALMIVGGTLRPGMPEDEYGAAMQEGAAAYEAGDAGEDDIEYALGVVTQVIADIGAAGEDELRRIAESN